MDYYILFYIKNQQIAMKYGNFLDFMKFAFLYNLLYNLYLITMNLERNKIMLDLYYTIINTKYYNVKEVLKEQINISDRLLRRLKSNNKIFLNNKPISPNYNTLNIGDTISVDLDFEEEYDNIIPVKMDLDIIFEDNYLLIVNKSPNTPVHPSCNHFSDSLSNGVKFYFDSIGLKRKIRIVNRLDKDTSRNCCIR